VFLEKKLLKIVSAIIVIVLFMIKLGKNILEQLQGKTMRGNVKCSASIVALARNVKISAKNISTMIGNAMKG
jgi:hypothetical protein